jgi:hypothetical protein
MTPLGHILSQFARHLHLLDDVFPDGALQVLSFIPIIVGAILVVSITIPYFWTILPVYGFIIYFHIVKCRQAEEKFKKLESNTKILFI